MKVDRMMTEDDASGDEVTLLCSCINIGVICELKPDFAWSSLC